MGTALAALAKLGSRLSWPWCPLSTPSIPASLGPSWLSSRMCFPHRHIGLGMEGPAFPRWVRPQGGRSWCLLGHQCPPGEARACFEPTESDKSPRVILKRKSTVQPWRRGRWPCLLSARLGHGGSEVCSTHPTSPAYSLHPPSLPRRANWSTSERMPSPAGVCLPAELKSLGARRGGAG